MPGDLTATRCAFSVTLLSSQSGLLDSDSSSRSGAAAIRSQDPDRVRAVPALSGECDLGVERSQVTSALVQLEHVTMGRDRVDEVESRAASRRRTHSEWKPGPAEVCGDRIEVVDEERKVMEPRLTGRPPFA